MAPVVPVALRATLVPTQIPLDGTPAKPVGAEGPVGSVKVALKPLLPEGQEVLLIFILVYAPAVKPVIVIQPEASAV